MAKPKLSIMSSINSTANTFSKAATLTADRLVGTPKTDDGLATYMKLKKEDFDDLERELGWEAVSQYIRSMEIKNLRRS